MNECKTQLFLLLQEYAKNFQLEIPKISLDSKYQRRELTWVEIQMQPDFRQMRGVIMQVSERRKKTLEIFHEKKSLSYKEILEETSEFGDPVDILSDIDTLVFFRFLQNVGVKRSEIIPETKLELRPNTKKQIKNDPSRIDSRLEELGREFPSWYRKLVILIILDRKMNADEILEALHKQCPHVEWHRLLIKASLKILEDSRFISTKKQQGSTIYTLESRGEVLLSKSPFQQFSILRGLKDEFKNEFRIYEILRLVSEHDSSAISSGRIVSYLQSRYGIRGNKRMSIRNTLESMVYSGLLRVIGGTEKRGGHVYCLGETAEHLLSEKSREAVYIRRVESKHVEKFKETVEKFFEDYKNDVKRDILSSIMEILEDIGQYKGDLSLQSTTLWEAHIALLSDYIRDEKADTWEKKMFQCIIACILSRLLPSPLSVEMLKDYRPPLPDSEVKYPYYNNIAREYYFNLTEAYLSLGLNEKAFQSFDILKVLSWESFEFLILEGIIETKKGNMHGALDVFKKALKISRGSDKIVSLFHIGLAYYQRGYFKEAKETWSQCLELECTLSQRIILHHNLANVHRLLGELEKSRENYKYCIALAGTVPEREEYKLKSLIGLADVLIDLCSWDEAEKILREIIQESAEKFLPVAAMAKTNLGILLSRKGKYEKALAYYKEALVMVDKGLNSQEYGIILHDMGDVLRQLRILDDALAVLKEAYELLKNENIWLLHIIEISMAEVYIDVGNFEESWKLAQSVLQDRWLDNQRVEAEAWRIQGKILLRKNEFKKAKELLMRSEEIFREYELCYELTGVLQLLEECCKALGDEEQAIQYRNQIRDLTPIIGFLR